jgi:hypothetical protein
MKGRANIVVDAEQWKLFRMACIQHDTTASAEIEAFIKTRLEQWDKKGGSKKK